MVSFPNAKINLGLNIVRKRADGYHDLETAFYPIDWHDVLELHEATPASGTASGVRFTLTGLKIDGDPNTNICLRAWHLLKRDFAGLPSADMHLHKVIPMGAGLGGGSADGSFALMMMNELFHLELSEERLIALALELGSDCPFFIRNRPCFAQGRGEKMTDSQLDLSHYSLMVVHPGIHVSTALAFSGVKPSNPKESIEQIVKSPVETWKDRLINDFEISVFHSFPEIAGIKASLYAAGAIYASMSGSGSCVYGIFPKGQLPELDFPKTYHVFRQDELRPAYLK